MKSYHLVGQALDFVPIAEGKAQWSKSAYAKASFYAAIQYAEKLGFESGYRWGWDAPHLQFNYKGYGTNKFLTTAASAPINVLMKEEVLALQQKLVKLGQWGRWHLRKRHHQCCDDPAAPYRAGLAIDGVAGKTTLAKIDELLKKKSFVGTQGIFRVITGTFGTPEVAEKAAKVLSFNARKGTEDNRVYTGVFTLLESAEEARALIEVEYGYNLKIKSYSA